MTEPAPPNPQPNRKTMEFSELFKQKLADDILISLAKDEDFLEEVAMEAAIKIVGEVLFPGNDLSSEVSGLIADKLAKTIKYNLG